VVIQGGDFRKMNSKRSLISTLLNLDYIYIFVNPKNGEVKLPENLKSQESVTLRLSRHFKGELKIEADHILAVLSFNSVYHACYLPYSCIWAVASPDGQTILWLEDAPESVKAESLTFNRSCKKQVSHLRRIK